MIYARRVDDTAAASRLVDGIVARDLGRIEGCFGADARLRAPAPRRLRVEDRPQAIAARYGAWLRSLESFLVSSSDVEQVAGRVRVRHRFRGRDSAKGRQENEHTAYATVVDGRIAALDLSCAGFRPAEPPP